MRTTQSRGLICCERPLARSLNPPEQGQIQEDLFKIKGSRPHTCTVGLWRQITCKLRGIKKVLLNFFLYMLMGPAEVPDR